MLIHMHPFVTPACPNVTYFFPLRLLPSVPLNSAPLASSPLGAPEARVFLCLGFFKWCSGIHSSW